MSERQFIVKIGKGPDEMTFDECMVHIKRVLFWDYIDGEWCDVVPLYDRRWDELAGYIRGAHEREVDALKAENAKLRDLVTEMHGWTSKVVCRGEWPEFEYEDVCEKMRQLGIEVE